MRKTARYLRNHLKISIVFISSEKSTPKPEIQ
nr:MAG TPA: hypothetical protein [Caudoviricetes sp.]